ncbi:MAG: flagellar hook-basal body complex protein [Candidatus Marinimicrobia bacterium]|nr:flagellar hook-basal body complex protein [Candidatus Neomarinimicrobiota bacterium]
MALSFQIPVSALSQHQKRIEVLSKNISNLNTFGYKGSRMTFMETLGSVSGVTQFQFQQGNITATGRTTDLAIDGDSFFILKNNYGENVYSRLGAFDVNEKGQLVNTDGYVVQGWMRDITLANPSFSKSLGNIVIDANLKKPGIATKNAYLTGNLNSGIESVKEVWESATAYDANDNMISSSTVTFPMSVTSGVNDEFNISFNGGVAENVTVSAGNYNSLNALVAELNAQFSTNANLYGKVTAFNAGGILQIRNTAGNDGDMMTLTAGTNDILTTMGITPATSTYREASTSTEINSLLQVSKGLISGDQIIITGKDSEGDDISASFTYGAANDGTTVNDLLSVINTAFSGSAEATFEDGKIVLTDLVSGESESSIGLVVSSTSTGSLLIPSFTNSAEGYTAKVTTSLIAYDSLGNSHNVTIDFIKPENTVQNYGKWKWQAAVGGDETIINGGSGTVEFNSDGDLVAFMYDGGVDSFSIDPQNGASPINMKLQVAAQGEFSGLTQYNTVSSVEVRDQDGAAAGKINGIKVETDGSIVASFTNGQDDVIAILAMAKFANPNGLDNIGAGNFLESADSGVAKLGQANAQNSEIISESLESSTMDLADQFARLIEAQNAYQASARVVTTIQEIADQAVALKR